MLSKFITNMIHLIVDGYPTASPNNHPAGPLMSNFIALLIHDPNESQIVDQKYQQIHGIFIINTSNFMWI